VIELNDFRIVACLTSALSILTPTFATAQGYNSSDLGRHRDYAGKPCLHVEGTSRRHALAPTVFDHIMDIDNRCIQAIKAKICYHKTEQCIDVNAAGHTRKEYFLGSFPSQSQFQYDLKEHFDAPAVGQR
jgi:hypothetical protein